MTGNANSFDDAFTMTRTSHCVAQAAPQATQNLHRSNHFRASFGGRGWRTAKKFGPREDVFRLSIVNVVMAQSQLN